MIYKKIIPVLLLTLLISSRAFAQQQAYSYSQFADNLTPVNSAYSMLDKSGSITALGHKQLAGIDDAPSSLLFTGSFPIASISASAGVYLLNNRSPLVRQLEVNAFFAKSIQITATDYLSVSLNGGLRNYASNFSALDPSDPEFMSDVRDTKPNIGFSILYYSDKFYLGLSMPQLTFGSPETAFGQQTNLLKSHCYFTGAYLARLTDNVKFKPAALISYVRDEPLWGSLSGTLYLVEKIGVGVSYDSDDYLGAMLSINFNSFRVGYSYAAGTSGGNNTGSLNNARNEIGLTYRFGKQQPPKFL